MRENHWTRRRIIAASGAGIGAVVALAGCTGARADEDDDEEPEVGVSGSTNVSAE